MKDFIEESTKNMQKTWTQWEHMVSELAGMNGTAASFLQWNPGVATMRYTFDMNMKVWRNFMDHNEATILKVLKETPFHNDATESQIRGAWDSMKKGVEAYQAVVEAQFQKMEDLLKQKAKEAVA